MSDIDFYFLIGGIILCIIVGIAFVSGMEDMTQRRRAWNLWAAGVIDDAELRRRVDR